MIVNLRKTADVTKLSRDFLASYLHTRQKKLVIAGFAKGKCFGLFKEIVSKFWLATLYELKEIILLIKFYTPDIRGSHTFFVDFRGI